MSGSTMANSSNNAVMIGAEEPPAFRRLRYTKQILLIVGASLAYVSIGMFLMWPNNLASQIKSDNRTIFATEIRFSDWQLDMAASMIFMGSMPGFFISGWLVSKIGRRWSMLASCIPAIIGEFLIAFSYNTVMLLTGRFFDGVSFGMVNVAIRTYIVEISDHRIRGGACIIVNILMQIGSISILCAGLLLNWYYLVLISGGIMLIYCLLIVPNLPESPTYLAVNDRDSEALDILFKLRGPYVNIKEELSHLKKMNECSGHKLGYRDLFRNENLKKLLTIFGLFLVCNFSGVQVLKANTTRILEASGLSLDKRIGTIIVTCVLFIGNFSMMLLVDKLGRKRCLVVSLTMMAVAYFSLGIYTAFLDAGYFRTQVQIIPLTAEVRNSTVVYKDHTSSDAGMVWSWIPLVCLILAALGQSSGAGPLPFVLAPEYFPTNIRSQGASLCTMMGGLQSFAVLQLYSPTQYALTQAGLYWTYAFAATIGVPFTIFFIQETSRKRVG